ncbi:MAG: capsid protein [Clostridiales bacterium]|nr:capsid protein [Clostridiales bacterium]
MADQIKTPRGTIIKTKDGTTCKLVWNPNFAPKRNQQYSRAQKFVDSEVLRLSAPYVPLRTSMLLKSGQLGTDIGSGEVQYIAPYAHKQYYSPRKPGSATGALRGPLWFERMKADHGKEIIAGAKKIAGGG